MEESVDYEPLSRSAGGMREDEHEDQEMESVGHKRGRYETDHRAQGSHPSKRQAVSSHMHLRLLCPLPRSGCVIGKGGEVIKRLRSETGAKIKVEDQMTGCDERVVSISSANEASEDRCPAQNALLRVHECILEGEAKDPEHAGQPTVRLLVPNSQIGCILGKGGSIVSDIRSKSGARVKIFGPSERPAIAGSDDELVQITGDPQCVKAALEDILARLRDNPPRNFPQARSISITANATLGSLPSGILPGNGILGGNGIGNGLPGSEANAQLQHLLQGRGSPVPSMPVEVAFWLLVPPTQAGMIIGRKGEVIRRMRNEIDARVRVHNAADEKADRVVHILAVEDDRNAGAAQEALLQCCRCLAPDQNSHCSFRMIVPSRQIGAVLGKQGKTITQLRAETNVSVRVVDPPWAAGSFPSEADCRPESLADLESKLEVLQIEGRQILALAAVRAASSLLREWQVRNQTGSNGMVAGGDAPLLGNGARMHNPATQGLLQDALANSGLNGGLQAPNTLLALQALLESLGGGQHRAGSPLNSLHGPAMGAPLGHRPPGPGLSRAGREHECLTRVYIEAGDVGLVLGRGGANITRIRERSGAHVKLREERLEGGRREVELSGSPDKVKAAQHLLQGYLVNGPRRMNGGYHGRMSR